MTNACEFSPCRDYRYTLLHQLYDDFEVLPVVSPSRIMWIGLNPSTADENQLDPTLRRVRDYSKRWGHTEFVMTNLFAYRATLPRDMKRHHAPIGADNDEWLVRTAKTSRAVIACWGADGAHLHRAKRVENLMSMNRVSLWCLARNADGSPGHPLYLKKTSVLTPYP